MTDRRCVVMCSVSRWSRRQRRSTRFLRQGCLLTPDPDAPAAWTAVGRDGTREAVALDEAAALGFAQAAAAAFGVGESRSVRFDRARAQADAAKKA